jgi:uncharacterized repeat protein (TIGR01451 family)
VAPPCVQGGDLAPEHVLVNFPVPPGFVGPLPALGPPNFLIGPNAGVVWTRFTISPDPVAEDWDGSGEFLSGETEDYLLLVIDAADLSITKTDDPDPVIVGEDLTYTVTVTNNGPSDATGVSVTDTLPSGVTYNSDTPSQGSYDNSTGVWDVGNLASGASATLILVVTVDSSTTGTLTNDVSVIGEQDDPDPGNNIDTEDSKVSSPIVAAVPAISLWGGVVLALLLSVLMVWTMRRRTS